MRPLSCKCLDFNASISDLLMHWERHVWVNIPILHALNQIHRTVVILEDTIEERAFSPVRVTSIIDHTSAQISGWAVHGHS